MVLFLKNIRMYFIVENLSWHFFKIRKCFMLDSKNQLPWKWLNFAASHAFKSLIMLMEVNTVVDQALLLSNKGRKDMTFSLTVLTLRSLFHLIRNPCERRSLQLQGLQPWLGGSVASGSRSPPLPCEELLGAAEVWTSPLQPMPGSPWLHRPHVLTSGLWSSCWRTFGKREVTSRQLALSRSS